MTDFSFLRTFVPGSKKSADGTFVPVELSFRGTYAPWNFRTGGTVVPREQTIQELSLPGTFCGTFVFFRMIIIRIFAPVVKNDLKL